MQRTYRIILFIAIFALSLQPLKGAGLLFSREAPQTYLDLFSGNYISFTNSVTISFDLSILSHESFGQIWVYEDKAAPYSFAYIGRDKSSSSFVINSLSDKKQFLEIPVSPQAIGTRKWLHIETKLDFQHQKAEVTIDGQKYLLDGITIPNPSKANLIFGANNKAIPEVPVMVIKNIMVQDEAAHTFLFPLTESDGNKVHEAGNKLYGTVVNPTWQINKQFYWQEIGTFTSSAAAGIAFDELNRQLIVVGDNNISKFDINTLKLTEYKKETVGTQTGYSGEAIYNPDKQETYFYNLADIGGQTGPFFSTIPDQDLPTRIVSPKFSNPLHHHAYFFDQDSQSLYIFGGYGNYQYSNQTYQYDFDNGTWKEIHFTGDSIYPRMHTVAGKGPVPGSFFVFGGVGNETGKQELGKDFFCDLYLFDTSKRTIQKLWSRAFPDNYFIPTRGLVFDSQKGCIYLLCIDRTTTNASLHRFDVKTGEHAIVSNEIIFQTNCILSTAYLFNNPEDNELYSVIRYSEDNNPEAKISIYKLNAPPITYQELKKWNTDDDNETSRGYLYYIIAGIAFLVFLYAVYYWRRKKNSKEVEAPATSDDVVSANEEGADSIQPQSPVDAPASTLIKTNSIYLFGDFQAFDAKGNEIAYRFGPKIKQMFVLVLLHSHDGQEGISTGKLSAQLWPEKTTTAAKNIRNVTINHLRNILTDLEEVELVFLNDKWKIIYGDNFYCDYLKALSIANTLQQAHSPQEEDVKQLISLLQRGILLPPFVHYEWFGNIKINHDELFIRIIEKLLPVVEANNEPRKVIVLADVLFSFDGMSETALTFKIKALKKLGQKAYAQSVYERFQKEYQQLYGEKYKGNPLEE